MPCLLGSVQASNALFLLAIGIITNVWLTRPLAIAQRDMRLTWCPNTTNRSFGQVLKYRSRVNVIFVAISHLTLRRGNSHSRNDFVLLTREPPTPRAVRRRCIRLIKLGDRTITCVASIQLPKSTPPHAQVTAINSAVARNVAVLNISISVLPDIPLPRQKVRSIDVAIEIKISGEHPLPEDRLHRPHIDARSIHSHKGNAALIVQRSVKVVGVERRIAGLPGSSACVSSLYLPGSLGPPLSARGAKRGSTTPPSGPPMRLP